MSEIRPEVLAMNLADTGLNVRIVSSMEAIDVFTVGQLLELTEYEFCTHGKNCGKQGLAEVRGLFLDYHAHNWKPDCLADWMLERGVDLAAIATLLGCRFSEVTERRMGIAEIKAAQHANQLSEIEEIPNPAEMPSLQQEAKEWCDANSNNCCKGGRHNSQVVKRYGKQRIRKPVMVSLPKSVIDALEKESDYV